MPRIAAALALAALLLPVVPPVPPAAAFSFENLEWSYPGQYDRPTGLPGLNPTTGSLGVDQRSGTQYTGWVGAPIVARLTASSFVVASTMAGGNSGGPRLKATVCNAVNPVASDRTPYPTVCGMSDPTPQIDLDVGSVNLAGHHAASAPSLTGAGVCWTNGASGAFDVGFARFDASGANGPVRVVDDAITTTKACSVSSVSDQVWFVAYVDTTAAPHVLKMKGSTDGGATWQPFPTIESQTTIHNVLLLSKSADHHIVLYGFQGGLRTCVSTDGAQSFACSTFTNTVPGGLYGKVHGGHFYALAELGGPRLLKSTDGAGWVQRIVPHVNQFDISGDGTFLIPHAEGTSASPPSLIRGMTTGTCLVTSPCAEVSFGDYYTSNDDGVTWSARIEGARTLCSSQYGSCSASGLASAVFLGDALAIAFTWILPGANGAQGQLTISVSARSRALHTVEVAVNNLVGFDVDDTGTNIITRQHGGNNILTYNGGNLAQVGLDIDPATSCEGRPDGVVAELKVVAYLICNEDGDDPTHIRVKTLALTDYPYGGNCDQGGGCESDISLSGFSSSGGDRMGQIADIWYFPLDRSAQTSDTRLSNAYKRDTAWGWDSFDGRIGVNMFTSREGTLRQAKEDIRRTVEATYGSQQPHQTKVCLNGATGNWWLTAAKNDEAHVPVYDVIFYQEQGAYISNLNARLNGPQLLPQSVGVACDTAGHFLLQRPPPINRIALYNRSFPHQPVWERGYTFTANGAVAMSEDGNFVAWLDASVVRIAHASNGTVTGSFPVPAGVFVDLQLDQTAQNAFVATSTRLKRVHITPITTVLDSCIICTPASDDVTPETSGNTFVLAKGEGALGKFLPGAGLPPVKYTLSILTMLLPMFLTFRVTGGGINGVGKIYSGNAQAISVAAFFGACLAVIFWGFPLWPVLLTSVVAVALIVTRFF